jgi:hypothetical protein
VTCGYARKDQLIQETPASGRALLDDPVEILGYDELRVRAESLLKDEPATAELSRRMDEKGFTARAEQLRALQRDLCEDVVIMVLPVLLASRRPALRRAGRWLACGDLAL